MLASTLKKLLRQAFLFGAPLTLIGAGVTWNNLHPESALLFILLVPAVLLRYANWVDGAWLAVWFVVLQYAYYLLLAILFQLVKHFSEKLKSKDSEC
jgi:hypothetical protein